MKMSDGYDGYKIIYDGIYGSMKVFGVIFDFVKILEF